MNGLDDTAVRRSDGKEPPTVVGDPSAPGVSSGLWTRFGKRPVDLITSLLMLIVLSPILLLTALAIKVTSRGPVLFTQVRGGRDGRPFRLSKFRTMSGRRKPDPKELVPLDHPDITRLGRVLRRSKIDELPQLLNVLRGDMSLIGPRPTLPDQVEAYDAFRRQRLWVRPGITGLAQVYSNAARPWDERILYDIAYVRGCSLTLDLAILFRTLLVIVVGEERTARPFLRTCYSQWVVPPADFEMDAGSDSQPHGPA